MNCTCRVIAVEGGIRFNQIHGIEYPDVCNDNTLDKQQVLDFVANGKVWLNIAMVTKDMPSLEEYWSNPKYKFTREAEGEISINITARERSTCVHIPLTSLRLEDKQTGLDEYCRSETGRASDTFAVLSFAQWNGWFRLFSQRPEDYVWLFMCDRGSNTSTYDYDSCEMGHMDLLISDPRSETTDSVGVGEKIRDLTGLVVTDDSRFIGTFMSPVSVVWYEDLDEQECSF